MYPYHEHIFVQELMSAFCICCINSSALQTRFYHGSKGYEQSDLGPFCLQYAGYLRTQAYEWADNKSRNWREKGQIKNRICFWELRELRFDTTEIYKNLCCNKL